MSEPPFRDDLGEEWDDLDEDAFRIGCIPPLIALVIAILIALYSILKPFLENL